MSEAPLRTIAIVGGGAEAWTVAALLGRALRGQIGLVCIDPREPPEEVPLIGGPGIATLGRLLDIDLDRLAAASAAAPWLAERRHTGGSTGLIPSAAPGGMIAGLPFAEAWIRLSATGHALAAPASFSLEAEAARAGRYSPGQELRPGFVLDPGAWATVARARALAGGVEPVAGTLVDVEQAGGEVAALRLADGRRIAADFFIDVSGRPAVLAGRLPGRSWEDWSPLIPGDRITYLRLPAGDAQPLVLRAGAEENSEWVAMRFGAEERIVIVSSGDISPDALARLAGGRRVVSATSSSVNPGRRTPWIANVLALGRAASDIGPADHRSLERLASGVIRFLALLPDRTHAPALATEYGRQAAREDEECRDFAVLSSGAGGSRPLPDTLCCRIDRYRAAGILPAGSDLVDAASWFVALHAALGLPEDAQRLPVDKRAAVAAGFAQSMQETAKRVSAMPLLRLA